MPLANASDSFDESLDIEIEPFFGDASERSPLSFGVLMSLLVVSDTLL